VKTWDKSVEAGDIRDREDANEDDWGEGEECEDLMRGLEVF
jgi:hypothetical protein